METRNSIMTFQALLFATAILWLALCGAILQSVIWCLAGRRPRFIGAMILSAMAAGASIAGFVLLRVHYIHEVNGQTALRLDSRWFFFASFILGMAAFTNAARLRLRFGAAPEHRSY
jgi:hypothetical protein